MKYLIGNLMSRVISEKRFERERGTQVFTSRENDSKRKCGLKKRREIAFKMAVCNDSIRKMFLLFFIISTILGNLLEQGF